jgi:hypothetical protein
VLLERLLATKRSIAVVAFEDVGWEIKMLVDSLLAAEGPITVFALVHWSVGSPLAKHVL